MEIPKELLSGCIMFHDLFSAGAEKLFGKDKFCKQFHC